MKRICMKLSAALLLLALAGAAALAEGAGALPVELVCGGIAFEDACGRCTFRGGFANVRDLPLEQIKFVECRMRATRDGTFNVALIAPNGKVLRWRHTAFTAGVEYSLRGFHCVDAEQIQEGEYLLLADGELVGSFLVDIVPGEQGEKYLQPRPDVYVGTAGVACGNGDDWAFTRMRYRVAEEEMDSEHFYIGVQLISSSDEPVCVDVKLLDKLAGDGGKLCGDPEGMLLRNRGDSQTVLYEIPADRIGSVYVVYLDDEPVYEFDVCDLNGAFG